MKILFVTTISNTVNAFLIPHIKMLIEEGHQVDLAFDIEQKPRKEILNMGCTVHEIPFHRSPLKNNNYLAYKKMKELIKKGRYDLIHTHTPVASAITRLAARNFRKNGLKVFYTAHGFHFFNGAPLKNWLLYYPIERYLSNITDCLITINQEDYNRAKRSFKAGSIEYIHGVGLNLEKFARKNINIGEKRKSILTKTDSFVLLSVGELNKNKNHEVIINSIAELGYSNIEYIICGVGSLENHLKKKTKRMGLESQIHFLGYRNDIPEICNISDVFVFPSLREGLGMAALEAMACGLPLITSNIHGILDYSVDGVTGLTCNPKSSMEFMRAIRKMKEDKELRRRISKTNISYVQKYSITNTLEKMKKIYTL